MAYSETWDPAYPNGATEDADDLDTIIQTVTRMVAERLTSLLGVTITTDPLVMTKLDQVATIVTKQIHQPEIAKSTVGNAVTLDFTVDGNTVAVTINGGPSTITLSNLKTGGRYLVRIINPSAYQFAFTGGTIKYTGAARSWTTTDGIYSIYQGADGVTRIAPSVGYAT